MKTDGVCYFVQFLSGGGLLSRLGSFPVDSLNEETVELVQALLESKDFEVELVKQSCGTLVAGLHAWARAVCSHYTVNKNVMNTKVD